MKIDMGWAYGTHEWTKRCVQGLMERPEGKRPLGRPCHKANDDIKMGLKEVGFVGMDRIDVERTSQLLRKDSTPWSYQ
jgi:hypothetical protein